MSCTPVCGCIRYVACSWRNRTMVLTSSFLTTRRVVWSMTRPQRSHTYSFVVPSSSEGSTSVWSSSIGKKPSVLGRLPQIQTHAPRSLPSYCIRPVDVFDIVVSLRSHLLLFISTHGCAVPLRYSRGQGAYRHQPVHRATRGGISKAVARLCSSAVPTSALPSSTPRTVS